METQSHYHHLIEKLDAFIRKYYVNQLIRGALITTGLVLALFLIYNLLEHQFYFSGNVRLVLLLSFIGVSAVSLGVLVLKPLAQYFHLGKVISHDQAAMIIGRHFQPVEDKLLNVLQLKRQADQYGESTELLMAGIEQKTREIEIVPFKNAIDLTRNRKYLRYALPPFLLLLAILFVDATIIRNSTYRLIHTQQVFEKEAPFRFVLDQPQDFSVIQYDDFTLELQTEGSMVPAEVFIEIDNYSYRMRKEKAAAFSYTFKNVQNDTRFRVFAGPVSSPEMELAVIRKPGIAEFDIDLDYPAYTGRRDEVLSNIGDLVVPEGTALTWDIMALHTASLGVKFEGQPTSREAERRSEDRFVLKSKALENGRYTLYLHHELLPLPDSVQYSIRVIPDRYPGIRVESFTDSLDQKLIYFAGSTDDDYGIRSLHFQYEVMDAQGQIIRKETEGLDVPHPTQFSYTHAFDLETIGLKAGEQVQYYFEVHDNDGIHGSKASRTPVMQFRKPTAEEYNQKENKNNADIQFNLEKSMKETRELQQDMKRLREKLMQEKKAEWQDKKEIEKLLERHQNLQEQMQDAMEKFQENIQNQQEHTQPSEQLMEKQEQLQKLFDELMSEEMKELMKKMEELMQQLEKEGAIDMMEEFEMNDQELEKELDRMLELFKQLEVEAEMEQAIEKLQEMAEEQEQLSKETEQQEKSNDELEADQEKLNEEFDSLQQDIKETMKKNEELERPKDMEGAEEQMEKIDQDMENSEQQLEQDQPKNASKSQKNAAQRMRDMANQMQQQMQSSQQEQMQEDMAMLRQLLENLVTLSFDQEELIDDIAVTEVTTPRYVNLVQDQFRIQQDFKVVEDTLHALSKRVAQIESFVTEKVTDIKVNLKKGIEQLEERNKGVAGDHQQRTMTYLNDLALMLSEVMNQMQQQMSNMMPGSQMCNNPGGKGSGKSGRVPMDKISQGQQELNEGMEQLLNKMRNGDKGKMSKDFAQMAAKQAALRKALKDLAQEKKEQGKGQPELDRIGDEMNKIEIDLVNKRLNQETLKRQQDIMTRLLEAEKSERQRDQDERRQAETAKEQKRAMPPALEQYIRQREAEIEQYKSVSPDLKPYYKFLVEEYYQSLKKTN